MPETTQLPPPPPLNAPKSEWRRWAITHRGDLPDVSAELTQHAAQLLRGLGAHTVLLYHAMPGEPDLSGLQGEFRLLTTRARTKPERRLTVHPWETATEKSPVGVIQPPANTPEVPLVDIDAVVLPGVAFSRSGLRLGYGGGFYDRFLAQLRRDRPDLPILAAVPSALLLSKLPQEPHDMAADWLITEKGAQRAQPEA